MAKKTDRTVERGDGLRRLGVRPILLSLICSRIVCPALPISLSPCRATQPPRKAIGRSLLLRKIEGRVSWRLSSSPRIGTGQRGCPCRGRAPLPWQGTHRRTLGDPAPSLRGSWRERRHSSRCRPPEPPSSSSSSLERLHRSIEMDSSYTQPEGSHPSVTKNPAMSSCRKKKTDDATFLEDVKDHIDEFINASMDEHKTCFKKTIQKMFGMSKIVAERSSAAKEAEVESVLPLQTSVSR